MLVGLFLIVMFVEYRKPGSGEASPFGLITPAYLLTNTTAWMAPTVMMLLVIHSKRFRRLIEGR